MSLFEDVTLSFNRKNYKIEATNVMRCLAQVEDIITLQDLSNKTRVPLVKLSMAYGCVLRYAGADVTDEDVYAEVFKAGSAQAISNSIHTLITLMIPPERLQKTLSENGGSEKKSITKAKKRN